MQSDLPSLHQQFDTLLARPVPQPEPGRTTFLEIAGIAHREVYNSKIYQFYLSDHPEHGLGDLFLGSLVELIGEKWAEEERQEPLRVRKIAKEWTVETEVTTSSNKGRIDIWIEWQDEDVRKTIVVENKIYHHLHNDLEDYMNTPEGQPGDKVGVLLTLAPQHHRHPWFVNITHAEWLTRVQEKMGARIAGADDRHLLFLKDFILNTTKLFKNLESMHDFIEYYVANRKQIESIVAARNQFSAKLLDAFVKAGENLKWTARNKRGGHYRGLLPDPRHDFQLTLIFDDGNGWEYPCYIVLEIFGKALTSTDTLRKNEAFLQKHNLKTHTHQGAGYAYIAQKGYNFQDLGKRDLVEYFSDALNSTWKPASADFIRLLHDPG